MADPYPPFAPQPPAPPPPPPAPPVPPRRANSLRWVLLLAGGVLILCLAAGGFAIVGGVQLVQNLQQETGAVTQVLGQFMQAGERNDAGAGYALFASSVRGQVSQTDITSLFQNHREFFNGYQAVQTQNFRINTTTGSGTTAVFDGSITYTGRGAVPFTATLRKENNQWRLTQFQFQEGVGK